MKIFNNFMRFALCMALVPVVAFGATQQPNARGSAGRSGSASGATNANRTGTGVATEVQPEVGIHLVYRGANLSNIDARQHKHRVVGVIRIKRRIVTDTVVMSRRRTRTSS